MRTDLRLFIGDKLAVLATDSLIEFTYERERLTDPAVVKNSYSQSVTLPKCAENDAIFGHYGTTDRRTMSSAVSRVGVHFDPLRRMPFEIYNDFGECLQRGYCKMTEATDSYKVSLFGGLGELFYALSYDSQGNGRTLADLKYKDLDGVWIDPKATTASPLTASYISGAWNWLCNGGTPSDSTFGIVNFAPAYNGLPAKDFDADKAILRNGDFANINTSVGGAYTAKSGLGGAFLVTLGDKHTEWEVEDLRAYLQRPVLSVRALVEAIVHDAAANGITLSLGSWFSASNTDYSRMWLTLPIPDKALATSSTAKLSKYLNGDMSPADFLISYAKTYGLVFTYDPAEATASLLTRDEFYSAMETEGAIDLTTRLDLASLSVKPYDVGAKWYIWQNEQLGESAADYLALTGRRTGSHWLNTGYDFDATQKDVMSGLALKGAPCLAETSAWYIYYGTATASAWSAYWLKFGASEDLKLTLYNSSGASSQFSPLAFAPTAQHHYSLSSSWADLFPKVQLHDADNKAIDGAGVLVRFDGARVIEADDTDGSRPRFHLSDDSSAMLELNNGKPCWDLRQSWSVLGYIPKFSRGACEFSELFSRRWAGYMGDRLDVDSLVVSADVDLRGLRVGEHLLARLWYWDGAYWALNKISNHSLTTEGLTSCEFVKINDIDNYKDSQS